jgi:hypothetical protein
MTSVLRRYPHIESRTRFFVTLADSVTTYTFSLTPNGGDRHTGVADISEVGAGAPYTPVTLGANLLKDLGNTVYVYDTDTAGRRVQIAVMRLVKPVKGAATEGDDNTPPFWIATWVSNPPPSTPPITLAPVARTG